MMTILQFGVKCFIAFATIASILHTEYDYLFFGGISSVDSEGFNKTLQSTLESKEKCTMNSIRFFRIISFLEGLSYILLLFVAVPMKYMAGEASLVKSLGMPHGILFVLYVFLALFIRSKMNWNFATTLLVLVASLLPFGTFYIDRKYFGSK